MPVKPLLEDFVARFFGGDFCAQWCSSTRLVGSRRHSDGRGGFCDVQNDVSLVCGGVLWISSVQKKNE